MLPFREKPLLSPAPPPRNPRPALARGQQGIPGSAAVRGRGRETGVPCSPSPPRTRCRDDRAGPWGRRAHTAPARGCSLDALGLSRRALRGEGKPLPPRMRRSLPDLPPCGQGNPRTPQCALGAGWGNRLKPEWGLLRRWRGREGERGLPEVPAPVLAVALATGRAGRSEGGGGLREAGRLCACVELGAGGRGSPSCAPGTGGGEGGGSRRRGVGGCPGRRLSRREGLWRRGGW